MPGQMTTPDPVEPSVRSAVEGALAAHASQPGPLLLVLHAVQHSLGYVPPEAVPLIADALNLSRAEVHGVLTFYHYFRQTPPGRRVVRICQAEACQAMQGRRLTEHAQHRLGLRFHETTADGAVTLEPVYCLGNCACAPSVMIDDELHGRMTPERFDALLTAAAGSVRP